MLTDLLNLALLQRLQYKQCAEYTCTNWTNWCQHCKGTQETVDEQTPAKLLSFFQKRYATAYYPETRTVSGPYCTALHKNAKKEEYWCDFCCGIWAALYPLQPTPYGAVDIPCVIRRPDRGSLLVPHSNMCLERVWTIPRPLSSLNNSET